MRQTFGRLNNVESSPVPLTRYYDSSIQEFVRIWLHAKRATFARLGFVQPNRKLFTTPLLDDLGVSVFVVTKARVIKGVPSVTSSGQIPWSSG
jgi:hypothetical protein